MTAGILIIDDDIGTLEEVQWALTRDGYQVSVAQAGVDAVRKMLIDEPDLVILGVDTQERDWRFFRHLLTFKIQPLLLLLSTEDMMDQVKGLELGADDCLTKPFVLVELMARTRALLRRSVTSASRQQRSLFVDGDLLIDLTRREVRLDDQPIRLTPTEFQILSCLISQVGEVLSHKRILMQVWGPNYAGEHGILKPHIHSLRRKLEPDPSRPQRILTRRGEGYLFRRLATE
jgi:two-component system response regulator VicR